MNTFGGFRFATPALQLQNAPDLVFVFHRLRIGPFEGLANGKPPALPEVADSPVLMNNPG